MSEIRSFTHTGAWGCFLFCLLWGTSIIYPNTVAAQGTDSSVEQLGFLADRLDSLVAKELNDTLLGSPAGVGAEQLNMIFSADSALSAAYLTRMEITDKQRELRSKDLGFQLSAGYIENLEQGVFGAEGIFYQRRADFGLQWNLLKNGLLQSRTEEQRLSGQLRMLTEEAEIERSRDAYPEMQQRLKRAFNDFRLQLLEDHRNILKEEQSLAAQLYELDYIDLNEVLEITSRKTAAEGEIRSLQDHSTLLNSYSNAYPSPRDLPVYELLITELMDEALNFYRELDNPISDIPYQPLNEVSLSTYLRYNIYGGSGIQNIGGNLDTREFFSVGFSVGVPLPLGFSQKKDIHELQGKLISSEQNQDLRGVEREILDRYESYQERLGRYQNLQREYRRVRDNARNYLQSGAMAGAYSPADILNDISESYALALQLSDIKEGLYLELIAIQALIPDRLITQYLRPVESDEIDPYLARINGFYLWSETLLGQGAEQVISELRSASARVVYVSAGPEDLGLEDIKTLIRDNSGTKVHLMIADPNLIFPDHEDELQELIAQASEAGAAGIHLDVEPHTLPEWEQNKEEYLVLFRDLLQKANSVSDSAGLELSTSLSPSYIEVLSESAVMSDQSIMMLYGITDAGRYLTRLRALDPQGLIDTIALRTEDFSDRRSLMQFISELRRKGTIRNIVIQDLNGWLKLP